MAMHYRREVARLHAVLADEERRLEAVEIIRSLADRIVLTPVSEGKGSARAWRSTFKATLPAS
jgi:hypothetical protein